MEFSARYCSYADVGPPPSYGELEPTIANTIINSKWPICESDHKNDFDGTKHLSKSSSLFFGIF